MTTHVEKLLEATQDSVSIPTAPLESLIKNMKTYTKMSKSRGNVVLPEEVIHGVMDLKDGYEFRDASGNLIDWKAARVWRDHNYNYFTSTRTGRRPVFLHEIGNEVPCLLIVNGKEQLQHPELWSKIE